jgi:hypothetical protein
MFYFAINLGSVASILATPIIRSQFSYSFAFGLPAVLLMLSLIVFLLGCRTYVSIPPSGSVISKFFGILWSALIGRFSNSPQTNVVTNIVVICDPHLENESDKLTQMVQLKSLQQSQFNAHPAQAVEAPTPVVLSSCSSSSSSSSSPSNTHNHWLDYAINQGYSLSEVSDIKAVLKLLPFFACFPIFWALFDQNGSTWILQANSMDLKIGSITLQPEQLGIFNPVIVMICIPFFDRVVYPCFNHTFNCTLSPLSKIGFGMLLCAVTFFLSALIDMEIANNPTAATAASNLAVGDTNYKSSISVLWQLPQWVLISIAEVLVSVTGLQYSYDNAPVSMKGTLSSIWLLTVAVGDLILGLVYASLSTQVSTFYMDLGCGCIMMVNLFLFIWIMYNSPKLINTNSSITEMQLSASNSSTNIKTPPPSITVATDSIGQDIITSLRLSQVVPELILTSVESTVCKTNASAQHCNHQQCNEKHGVNSTISQNALCHIRESDVVVDVINLTDEQV